MNASQNAQERDFARRLDHAMKVRGLTQEAVAARLHVSHSAVSRWIKGSKPRGQRPVTLAEVLGVDVRWLLYGETDLHDDNLPAASPPPKKAAEEEPEVLKILREGPQGAARRMGTEEILKAHGEFLQLIVNHSNPVMRNGCAVTLEALAGELTRRALGKEVSTEALHHHESHTGNIVAFRSPWSGSGIWADLRGGVAAGMPIDAVNVEPIEVPHELADNQYCLRVFGESMAPKIPDGSIIVVEDFRDQGFPKKGKIVVYSDGAGSTLKVFGYRPAKAHEEGNTFGKVPILTSINPAYPSVQTMEGGRIEALFVEVLPNAIS